MNDLVTSVQGAAATAVHRKRFRGRMCHLLLSSLLVASGAICGFSSELAAQVQTPMTPVLSGGGEQLARPAPAAALAPRAMSTSLLTTSNEGGFEGLNFDDNGTLVGTLTIPPDPMVAAGTDRLISVVNVAIEARDKSGTLLWRDSLRDFMAGAPTPPGTLGTSTFDPKVLYDHYSDRFLVVTLEAQGDNNADPNDDASRILLAVSNTGTPGGLPDGSADPSQWRFYAIDSMINIGGDNARADFPGFAVDEEAIYITANMFAFTTDTTYEGVRLWILDKALYSGGSPRVSVYDPYAGGGAWTTTQPALVFGADGAGAGIGTYLVSFSGLTDGMDEYLQVVSVDDPLGAVQFRQAYLNVGNLDPVLVSLPSAPQPDTEVDIDVNDRRVLNTVWRDDALWLTATIEPNTGADAGQTTARWFSLDTSGDAPGSPLALTLGEQGNLGGEDIATGTYTYFPSVAVNGKGEAMFGFSASSPTTYAGAYAAGITIDTPLDSAEPTETVREGVDYYIRTFGGARNRWGDYSGTVVDPVDGCFWVFNEYAMTRGTATTSPPEDGRWGTYYSRICPCSQAIPLVANQWRQLALSCDPEQASTVAQIFDNFDPNTYGYRWGVFAWVASTGTYRLLGLTDSMTPGAGYWVRTLDSGQVLNVSGSSNAQIDIPLDASPSGLFNLVGLPYPADAAWADVRVVDGGNVLTLDEADPGGACEQQPVGAGCVMSRIAYRWNGVSYETFDGITAGSEGTLEAPDALWVRAYRDGIALRIPRNSSSAVPAPPE